MSVEERVAIVGAGPVGLLSALGLAQAGIPVIVIERASEIVASPRAITYHWSVLEGLDRLGLLEEALDVGFAKQDYTYLDFATGEKINYSLDVLDGRTSFLSISISAKTYLPKLRCADSSSFRMSRFAGV